MWSAIPRGPITEGDPIEWCIYPSYPPTTGDIFVTWEMPGPDPRKDLHGDGTPKRTSVKVPKEGVRYTMQAPDNNDVESNVDLHVRWRMNPGTNYQIHPDTVTDQIHVIDDDPILWYYIDETLGAGPYEGGTERTAKIALAGNRSRGDARRLSDDASNTLKVDLNVTGCALVPEPPSADAVPVGVGDDIPCWADITYGEGDDVWRASNDEFEIRQFVASANRLNSTIVIYLKVGQDADTTDETITMTPEFTINTSSGGVEERSDSVFPGTFTVYDDDEAPLPDEGGMDSIYILGTTLPSTPSGGTAQEHHTPQGWSRDELTPTSTENVYRSQRSRSYDSSDVFVSAGAWGTPEKVADLVPVEITVDFTNAGYAVSEHNGPSQPVLTATGTTTKDYHIPWTITPGTAKLGEDYENSSGEVIIAAGHTNWRGSFDIAIIDDDVVETSKAFTVTLGPFPPGTAGGALTTATVTVFDNESAPPSLELPPAGQISLRGVEADVVDEARNITVDLKLLSREAYQGPLVVKFANSNWLYKAIPFAQSEHEVTIPDVLLPAGKIFKRRITLQDVVTFNGGTPGPTNADEADRRMIVSLVPQDPVEGDGDVISPGYTVDSDEWYFVRIRDKEFTEVEVLSALVGATLSDHARDSSANRADIVLRLRDINLGSQRDLLPHETLEVPIRIYRSTGELLSTDEYEIDRHNGQENISVRKTDEGYAVKIEGRASGSSTCRSDFGVYSIGSTACLNFKSKLDQQHPNWNKPGVAASHPGVGYQTFYLDIDTSDPKFGATDINPGFKEQEAVVRGTYFFHVKKAGTGTNAEEPSFEIRPVRGVTAVREPTTGYAWLPFDLILGKEPTGATGIAFCTDRVETTASYYRDYTINGDDDYRFVSTHPQYGRWVSGYAWRANDNCSRAFSIRDRSARYYIRVLADSHDEGAEVIKLRVEGRNPKPDGEIPDSEYVTFTINNDGPMPAAWLARFGRTVAEQALDGIAGRLAAQRTPGMQGTIAGQALIVDPGPDDPSRSRGAGPGHGTFEGTGAVALADVARAFGADAGGPGAGHLDPHAAGFGATPLAAIAHHDGARRPARLELLADRHDRRRGRKPRVLGPRGARRLRRPRGDALARRRGHHGHARRGLCARQVAGGACACAKRGRRHVPQQRGGALGRRQRGGVADLGNPLCVARRLAAPEGLGRTRLRRRRGDAEDGAGRALRRRHHLAHGRGRGPGRCARSPCAGLRPRARAHLGCVLDAYRIGEDPQPRGVVLRT